jgi:hypothetical protein
MVLKCRPEKLKQFDHGKHRKTRKTFKDLWNLQIFTADLSRIFQLWHDPLQTLPEIKA